MGNNESKMSSDEDTITELSNSGERPVRGASKTNEAKVPEVVTTSSDSADDVPPPSKKSGGKKTDVDDMAPLAKKSGGKKTDVDKVPPAKKLGDEKTDVDMAAAAAAAAAPSKMSGNEKSDTPATKVGLAAAAPTPTSKNGKKMKKKDIQAKRKANLEKARAVQAEKKRKLDEEKEKETKALMKKLIKESLGDIGLGNSEEQDEESMKFNPEYVKKMVDEKVAQELPKALETITKEQSEKSKKNSKDIMALKVAHEKFKLQSEYEHVETKKKLEGMTKMGESMNNVEGMLAKFITGVSSKNGKPTLLDKPHREYDYSNPNYPNPNQYSNPPGLLAPNGQAYSNHHGYSQGGYPQGGFSQGPQMTLSFPPVYAPPPPTFPQTQQPPAMAPTQQPPAMAPSQHLMSSLTSPASGNGHGDTTSPPAPTGNFGYTNQGTLADSNTGMVNYAYNNQGSTNNQGNQGPANNPGPSNGNN